MKKIFKLAYKTEKSFYSTLLLSFLIISILLSTLLTLILSAVFTRSLVESTQEHNRQLLAQTNYGRFTRIRSISQFSGRHGRHLP